MKNKQPRWQLFADFARSCILHYRRKNCIQDTLSSRAALGLPADCMQDTFARATHSTYAAGMPSAARDDRVSCIQPGRVRRASKGIFQII